MFDHYYVSAQNGDPDHPEPLVVCLGKLDSEKIEKLPAYLIESIALRFNLDGLDTHLQARPLQFELEHGQRISERALWHLLIEQPDGVRFAAEYVDAAISLGSTDGALGFYSFLDVVGQDPIYAYLGRYFFEAESEPPMDVEGALAMADCFLRFLRHCDMDHETYQDDYIKLALSFLQRHDVDRMIDLLIFRLTTGQHSEPSRDHTDLLLINGVFRRVIDDLLSTDFYFYDDLVLLCHCVYGHAEKPTREVLSYCQQRKSINEQPLNKHTQRRAAWIGEFTELRLRDFGNRTHGINTGFHTYKPATNDWSRIDDESLLDGQP